MHTYLLTARPRLPSPPPEGGGKNVKGGEGLGGESRRRRSLPPLPISVLLRRRKCNDSETSASTNALPEGSTPYCIVCHQK